MRQGWRWFGPKDPVSLDDVRQAGATEIVSSLHHMPIAEAWTTKGVADYKSLIETTPAGRTPLALTVIESIPIPDDVKRTGGAAKRSIAMWIESLRAVAANDIKIVCYNFMPVVDWARTDLDWPMPNGATALRFDNDRFAAFELFILQRKGAEADYDAATQKRARTLFDKMEQKDIDYLIHVIASALPGSTTDPLTIPAFRDRLDTYRDVNAAKLRQHLIEFLEQVTPVAQSLGVTLTLHPDDPPRPLFGLPRIASSAQDYQALFDAVPSPANGMCFCTGSLGVAASNNLVEIAKQFAPRIAFAHLRATKREADGYSFHESDHLDGDFDMIAVLRVLLAENSKRSPSEKIVFRPDHGHRMLDDLRKTATPGYTGIGRLKGLAELRGAIRALQSV
ncbi:MAG: mannonate dehydratase [Beijerinckiaceae bacterium]